MAQAREHLPTFLGDLLISCNTFNFSQGIGDGYPGCRSTKTESKLKTCFGHQYHPDSAFFGKM
jgi:hypothetical protein